MSGFNQVYFLGSEGGYMGAPRLGVPFMAFVAAALTPAMLFAFA